MSVFQKVAASQSERTNPGFTRLRDIAQPDSPLLTIENYSVSFDTPNGPVVAVEDINLAINRGETYAFVGESGSGKTVTCLGLVRLLEGAYKTSGTVRLVDLDLTNVPDRALDNIRGRHIGIVFQDAVGSLDPIRTVGSHFAATIRRNTHLRGEAASRYAVELLAEVGLTDATVLAKHPHELSGGMAQRVAIALALVGDPELIVADEPTTALDAANKVRILQLLRRLCTQRRAALIFVTHDLLAAAKICDRVAVFYAGQIVEVARLNGGFSQLRHPYSLALLDSVPRLFGDPTPRPIPGEMPALANRDGLCRFRDRCPARVEKCGAIALYPDRSGKTQALCHFPAAPRVGGHVDRVAKTINALPPQKSPTANAAIVELHEVSKTFGHKRLDLFTRSSGHVALANVSLTVGKGECVALVGESGSGKSTIGRIILGLDRPTTGTVRFNLPQAARRLADSESKYPVQIIFQDARAAFDPRLTIGQQIEEPLRVNHIGSPAMRQERVREMLNRVHLSPSLTSALPHEVSGGQLQRVGIARALVLNPSLLVCDEPTSALDVSVQAQIVNLLIQLKQSLGLSLLFITHDLAAARPLADRIVVLHQGAVVEAGETERVLQQAQHSYTQNLILLSELGDPAGASAITHEGKRLVSLDRKKKDVFA